MVHHHRRFALFDVTYAGRPLPGATIDSWEDDAGQPHWIARVVMRTGPIAEDGELAGRMKNGGAMSGNVVVADRQGDSGGRRETVVQFHGSGQLTGLSDLPS